MIAAAALIPALMSALPYIAASTALTAWGAYEQKKAQQNALEKYGSNINNLGTKAQANVMTAAQGYAGPQFDQTRQAESDKLLTAYDNSRLPDVNVGAITGVGAPRSVSSDVASHIAEARDQGTRQFAAGAGMSGLSNLLFGNQLTDARMATANRGLSLQAGNALGTLRDIDLPKAAVAGQVQRALGALVGLAGSVASLGATAPATAAAGSGVTSAAMGGIGSATPVTVGSLAVPGGAAFTGLGTGLGAGSWLGLPRYSGLGGVSVPMPIR